MENLESRQLLTSLVGGGGDLGGADHLQVGFANALYGGGDELGVIAGNEGVQTGGVDSEASSRRMDVSPDARTAAADHLFADNHDSNEGHFSENAIMFCEHYVPFAQSFKDAAFAEFGSNDMGIW